MAISHPQAYINASELIAASPSLAPASLDLPHVGGDALLVIERPAHGLVAARTSGAFTHVVTGLDRPGIELWDAPFWRTEARGDLDDLPDLPRGPLDLTRALELLSDAPREAVLDAALAGPITLVDADPRRRAAWIAWLSATLPGPLTFTTFTTQPLDVRVCATTPEHAAAFTNAIDATVFTPGQPSRYARFATTIADRDPASLAPAEDAVTLAVHAGATDLLDPPDLLRALDLITALVQRGEIATAARATAGLGAHTTALVLAESHAHEIEILQQREPVDAEVIEDVEIVEWPTIEAPAAREALEPPREPEPVEAPNEAELFEPPVIAAPVHDFAATEPAPIEIDFDEPPTVAHEDSFGDGVSLHDFGEAEPAPVEAADEVEFDEPPVVAREESFGDGVSLHDLEEVAPEGERSLEELMASFASDPLEAPPDDEPELPDAGPELDEPPVLTREDSFGAGVSLHDLEEAAPEGERSLEELMAAFASDPLEAPAEDERVEPEESGAAAREDSPGSEAAGERSLEELMAVFTSDPLEAPEEPVDEVLEEEDLGMSLSELEASLAPHETVEESEVGMSLEEFEASLKRERES